MRANIENKCDQNWEAMAAGLEGRHCTQCQKTVYDFTTSSNEEIIRILLASQQLCGRFYSHQLDTELRPLSLKAPAKLMASVSLVFLFFSTAKLKGASAAKYPMEQIIPGHVNIAGQAPEISAKKAVDQASHWPPRSVRIVKTKKRQWYLGWRFPFLFSVRTYKITHHMGSVRWLD